MASIAAITSDVTINNLLFRKFVQCASFYCICGFCCRNSRKTVAAAALLLILNWWYYIPFAPVYLNRIREKLRNYSTCTILLFQANIRWLSSLAHRVGTVLTRSLVIIKRKITLAALCALAANILTRFTVCPTLYTVVLPVIKASSWTGNKLRRKQWALNLILIDFQNSSSRTFADAIFQLKRKIATTCVIAWRKSKVC